LNTTLKQQSGSTDFKQLQYLRKNNEIDPALVCQNLWYLDRIIRNVLV